ncbi:MAG: NAD(P)-dependent oxidoreductase, partial [Bacillota bacterium]|nr:NAD(P)-dependent oxidoreductase [Bacillota bacterium]
MAGRNIDMKDKKVLVVGMGRSGIAACRALCDAGAVVSAQDSKKEEELDEKTAALLNERGITKYLGKVPEDTSG